MRKKSSLDRSVGGAGKGDRRRPSFVSSKEFSDNWDLVFGKPADKILPQPAPECVDRIVGDQVVEIHRGPAPFRGMLALADEVFGKKWKKSNRR